MNLLWLSLAPFWLFLCVSVVMVGLNPIARRPERWWYVPFGVAFSITMICMFLAGLAMIVDLAL